MDAASPTAGAAAPAAEDAPIVRWLARPAGSPRITSGRVVAFVALVIVTALNLAAHPMWFDELQAWNIARTTDSLGDLTRLLHYGGHPIGWYLPLFTITRVTGNPVAMQVLHGAIAAGVYGMLLFRSPLRTSVAVVVAAGYLFSFENAVISRPYGLCTLLFLLAVDALARPQPRRGLAAVWLIALVFVHQLGAVLALAVALVEAWRVHTAAHGSDSGRRPDWRADRVAVAFLGVVVAAVLLMLLSVEPATDAGRDTFLGGRFDPDPVKRVALAFAAIAKGLVPLPRHLEWNDLIWEHVWLTITVTVSVLLWTAVLVLLWRDRAARLLWAVGSVGLVVFFIIGYRPIVVRHTGFFLVLLVGCAWYATAAVAPSSSGARRPARLLTGIAFAAVAGVAGAQLVAALVFAIHFASTPFDPSRESADAIRDAGLENRVVSGNDAAATPIAGYLDRDFYSVAFDGQRRYVVHRRRSLPRIRRASRRPDTTLAVAREIASCDGEPVAMVVDPFTLPIPDTTDLAPGVYEVPPGPRPATCPP